MSTPTTTRPIRVVVADDDPLARHAIIRALAADDRVRVVGQAEDANVALTLALVEQPDILIMDSRMPGLDATEATARITRESQDTRVILLAVSADEESGLAALRAGAVGFVPKAVNPATLVRVVHDVAAGKAAISRRLTMRLIERYRHMPGAAAGLRPVRSPLTPREWEVLDLLSTGASTQELASTLGLSQETIRSHIKSVLRKLRVHSRGEAVEKVRQLREGAIQPPEPPERERDRELRELEERLLRGRERAEPEGEEGEPPDRGEGEPREEG